MKDNGTDRDIALQMVTVLANLNNNLILLNDHLYVPHIVTQPTDQTTAVGDTSYFTVVANNVQSYQWQYKDSRYPDRPWSNYTTKPSAFTDTLEITITNDSYYLDMYRCEITGKDGSKIYTNSVVTINPTPAS